MKHRRTDDRRWSEGRPPARGDRHGPPTSPGPLDPTASAPPASAHSPRRRIRATSPAIKSPARPASIRAAYEALGSDQFYAAHGGDYANPHEPVLADLLRHVVIHHALDLSHVLDLAAGSGEATRALDPLGPRRVFAVDPYTHALYAARTGRPCAAVTFDEVAAGALAGESFSLIVCSFALHLVPPSRLPTLAWALADLSPRLIVLTPHKRPVLKPAWRWRLVDETLADRVRARLYERA